MCSKLLYPKEVLPINRDLLLSAMCHSQIFLINIFSKIEKKIEKSEFLSIALIYVVSKYILTYMIQDTLFIFY